MNALKSMFLLICWQLSIHYPVKAQPTILTVEDAIALALKNNYDIRLTRNDSASAAIDKAFAYGAFLPRINATTSKTWNTNAQKQELTNGAKRDTYGIRSNNLSGSIQLNWVLFDGLRMFATRNRINEIAKLGTLTIKNQAVNSVAAVVLNYYNIVRQKQQLKAILEQMNVNEERVKLAEKKLSVGLGAKPELLQAKVDVNAQKAAALRQNTLIGQLKEQLSQLTGLPNSNYDVSDSIPVNNALLLEQIKNNIENTNPALMAAKKNVAIAQIALKENTALLFPSLTFNTTYNYNRLVNKVVINNFTPIFNRVNGLNYGVGLSIPIFNGMNTHRLIKQSQLDIQFQQLLFDNQRTIVETTINNAYKDYELQKKALLLEEENIALAKENVAIALERFKQGVAVFLELREAQKSLEDGYNRLIAARYNLKVAETELLRLKGAIIK
jgi:outer membrane protein TolC